jgi:uncharacterized protein (UPF0303 family)
VVDVSLNSHLIVNSALAGWTSECMAVSVIRRKARGFQRLRRCNVMLVV